MNFNAVAIVFVCAFLQPQIRASRINLKTLENHALAEHPNDIVDAALFGDNQRNDNTAAYIKTSIPVRIFQCMQRLNILKCMKIFILQRMERTPTYLNSGNVTADFLDQILTNNSTHSEGDAAYESSLDKYYVQMPEQEINERLLKSFQRFFHDREIKLHFIPGMVVKVVPGEVNAINLTLKRGRFHSFLIRRNFSRGFDPFISFGKANTWAGTHGTGRGPQNKKGPGELLLQLGVPAAMMPAILMGTVLPFVLPALKFATIVSGIINHAALLSAIVYAAKSAVSVPDPIPNPVYYHDQFQRRSTVSYF